MGVVDAAKGLFAKCLRASLPESEGPLSATLSKKMIRQFYFEDKSFGKDKMWQTEIKVPACNRSSLIVCATHIFCARSFL